MATKSPEWCVKCGPPQLAAAGSNYCSRHQPDSQSSKKKATKTKGIKKKTTRKKACKKKR